MGDRWKLGTSPIDLLPVNGDIPLISDLQLDRAGRSLFTHTALQNPPGVSSLTASIWLIFENGAGNLIRVQGALNSLRAVPLPAGVLLFGAGLISMVGFGAGGLRNLPGSQS